MARRSTRRRRNVRRRLDRTTPLTAADAALGEDGFWTLSGGADALRQNQRGVLAAPQRTALLRGGLVLTAVFLALSGWWVYLAVGNSRTDPGDRWILGISGCLFILLSALILYYRVAAVRTGRVERVSGAVTVRSVAGRRQVEVHGRRFSASSRCPVVSGRKYRLYVTSKAAIVVAVEPAGAAEPR